MPKNRLNQFKQILTQQKLDGFIVSNPTNIFYLTGFRGISQTEREAYLVFSGLMATLVAPRLYQKEALALRSKDLKVVIAKERNELRGRVGVKLKHPPGVKLKIGFEENDMKYGEYKKISVILNEMKDLNSPRKRTNRSFAPQSGTQDDRGKELVAYQNLIENMRAAKTAGEIAKIEKAQVISQKAFFAIVKTLKPGQTEEEIANRLASIIKTLGGQGLAFTSIIASGPNSGIPHHVTSEKRIAKGEMLLLDFGAKFQNYHADLSRTIFIGKASDIQKNIYLHVQTAQKKALDVIKHEIKSSDAFHAANNHFKNHKLEKYFLHGLGHGIGLEVHEEPYLRPNTLPQARLGTTNRQAGLVDQILREGMVFSVEPGLYFPWGGVRIEDLVTIKGGKARVLGKLSEGIVEIKA